MRWGKNQYPSNDRLETLDSGAAVTYQEKKSFRRYTFWFAIATLVVSGVMNTVSSILIPNQIQFIEFARWFRGPDAGVDLTALKNLKDAVAAGAVATAGQLRQLDLLRAFDAGRTQALVLVNTLGVIALMVVSPVLGFLSDRTRSSLGRRAPWLLFESLTGALLLVLLRFASSVALLAPISALTVIVFGSALGFLNTTIADRAPQSMRGRLSAVGGMGASFGAVIGMLLIGALFIVLGLDVYFILSIILVLGVSVFVFLARDSSSIHLVAPAHRWGAFFKGFLVPMKDKAFRWIWITRAVFFFGYSTTITLTFFMLQSYLRPALSAVEATRILPLIGLIGLPALMAGMAISGWLSDKSGRRKPFLIFASLLMAASFLMPLLWPTLPALFVQSALSGFSLGIFITVNQALFIDVLPDRKSAGRDLGVAGLANSAGQVFGILLAGQLVALTGGYSAVWGVALVLVLITMAILMSIRHIR